jgi:hypothetical protein
MTQSAYIKFVQGSSVSSMTLSDVRELLARYVEQTALTGSQLGWEYSAAAFPYSIQDSGDERWFYLQGADKALYRHIIIGVGEAPNQNGSQVPCVQIVLPAEATHGDKAKANELCKYIAKQTRAELALFNGRTMYYNPRK